MTLNDILQRWQQFPANYRASVPELDELLQAARQATDAKLPIWNQLTEALVAHGGLKEGKAKAEVQACRVVADLGAYPDDVQAFVRLFLGVRGLRYTFKGAYHRASGGEIDVNNVYNQLKVWVATYGLYSIEAVGAALELWQDAEIERLRQEAFARLRHDPSLSDAELKRFVALMVAEEDDTTATTRNRAACEAALRGFIYRVKNHLRGRWQHKAHLMPIFYGPQGSGKSTGVELLLAPVEDFHSGVGFELFSDKSMEYQLTVMPVMLFEELAGAGKAEIEKVKAAMTQDRRQVREVYSRTANRRVISTFIGCTNRNIADVLRDETGNRRFIQFTTPEKIMLDAVRRLDFTAIWRCVDEDAAVPPIIADNGLLDVLQEVQGEQRFVGPVEDWLLSCRDLPIEVWRKAGELFAHSFGPFMAERYPHDRSYNANRLGWALKGLAAEGYAISSRPYGGSTQWWFTEAVRLGRDGAAKAAAAEKARAAAAAEAREQALMRDHDERIATFIKTNLAA
jgi:hypothetical protein